MPLIKPSDPPNAPNELIVQSALAVAGMKKYVQQHNIRGKTLLTLDSGANVNFDRLRYISERADIGEKKEILF